MTKPVQPRITAAMVAHGRPIAEPRLAPGDDRIAYVASVAGRGQLVITPTTGGPELLVTADPAPALAGGYAGGVFDWTPDGAALVYAGSDGALWSISATGGPSRKIVDPPPQGPASAPAISPDGRWVAFTVDQHYIAVALADGSAWPVRVSGSADFCFDPTWSADSTTVAWHEWDVPHMPWDSSRIAASRVDAPGVVTLLAGGDGVQVQQPRYSPDGTRLAFLSDERGWLNVWVANADGTDARPVVAEPHEHGTETWGQGQRSFVWSPDSSTIAFTRNERGFGRLCTVDLASGSTADVAKGVHGGLSWRGDAISSLRSGARTPTELVLYRDGVRSLLARATVGGFEAADLAEPEPVEWNDDDGELVHGRLYRPVTGSATGAEPPPMIVWVHGGPTNQWMVTFIPRIAFFVERGWAVLLVDHRGSTGWGRAYTQAMAGRWGELDVADTAAGMRAAVANGWADPRRMVPMGGSAGGFTVLNLLAHHPELCAAGVDLFGVADLFDLNETTHRFEAHYLHSVVGPLPAAAEDYRTRSPVNVAERITSPLLILQGQDDKVVPPAQSQSIADRLRALGRTVELHFYEGEGHGWRRPETIIDELGRIESFLRRHVLQWRGP